MWMVLHLAAVFEVARIQHVSLLEAYVFVGVGSSTYSITFNFMAIRQKQRKP